MSVSSRWDYRVAVRQVDDDKGNLVDDYSIIEVYYDRDNKPHSWCPASVEGDSVADLRTELRHMMIALDKPVLDLDDFP